MELLSSIGYFFSADPAVFTLQVSLLCIGFVVVYLVLFATRDILLRSDSFLWQFLAIILVAALPVVGFLIYLLVRSPMTLKDRRMLKMMEKILHKNQQQQQKKPQLQQNQQKKPQLIA